VLIKNVMMLQAFNTVFLQKQMFHENISQSLDPHKSECR